MRGKKYGCDSCGKYSRETEWNKQTNEQFADILEIGKGRTWRGHVYVCPSCKEIRPGMRIR